MGLTNKIRLASGLDFDSIVDGPGLRIVLWTQGCPHHCEGCHNPQTHDFFAGKEYLVDDLIQQIEASHLQQGLTLSGGEPFEQVQALIPIVKAARQKGLNIWCFSGYSYDEIIDDHDKLQLLQWLDILVDGKFEMDKKNFQLWYKGSSNQRIIDVQKSLRENEIVLSQYEKENIEMDRG